MELNKSDIEITERTAVQLFNDGIKADATRYDYTNKLKKVLCEYLGPILKGDPKKVEYQKNHPDKPKKGIKRQFFDADWQERVNEFVDLAISEPKTVEAILMSLVQKLKQRNRLEKTDLDYITSSHINHSLKPIKKLFDMNNVPFSWSRINAKWWSEGQIGESDFIGGIQHMVKEKIIDIPDLPEQASTTAKEAVPDWIKNNAGWWADGLIDEGDFVNGIKWLVEKGIIRV